MSKCIQLWIKRKQIFWQFGGFSNRYICFVPVPARFFLYHFSIFLQFFRYHKVIAVICIFTFLQIGNILYISIRTHDTIISKVGHINHLDTIIFFFACIHDSTRKVVQLQRNLDKLVKAKHEWNVGSISQNLTYALIHNC